MNKIISLLLCLVLLATGCTSSETTVEEAGATSEPEETVVPTATPYVSDELISYDAVFGVWFGYNEYRDQCMNMNEEEFSSFADEMMTNMIDLGLNTLYVHAVAFTDALYDSAIYPRSRYMTDTTFDSLAILVEKCHENNIHVEAWINPMRSVAVGEEDLLSDTNPIKQWINENNERVRIVSDRYYLNPAYSEVQDLICSVVQEIIENYDVDGIHMDDYFYPSDASSDRRFDAYIYGKATEENPDLTLKEFRTNNVDEMVMAIYQTVKQYDSSLWFGISPAGNLENDRDLMFADPSHWVEQGSVDYLIPQIYWGFYHPTKPFAETFDEWFEIVDGSNTILISGLAAYNVGYTFSALGGDAASEWEDNEELLAQELRYSMNMGASGGVFFNYSALFLPNAEVEENVENSIVHIKNEISSW